MENTYNIDNFISACESNMIQMTPAMEALNVKFIIDGIKKFIDKIIIFIKAIRIKIIDKQENQKAIFVINNESVTVNSLQGIRSKINQILHTALDPRNNKNPKELDNEIFKMKDLLGEFLEKLDIPVPKDSDGQVDKTNITTIDASYIISTIKAIESQIKSIKNRISTYEKSLVGYIENHGHDDSVSNTITNCNVCLGLVMKELNIYMKIASKKEIMTQNDL